MLRVLGLTGGIGSGKSTAARRFAELGAVLVDSDVLAREVVAGGREGAGEVVAAFGARCARRDGGEGSTGPRWRRSCSATRKPAPSSNAIVHPPGPGPRGGADRRRSP